MQSPNTEQPTDTQIPFMSIVIAVYNGGPDLERCLAGVAALDYTRMECILVDDASTDGVAAKLAGLYDLQLVLSQNQQR